MDALARAFSRRSWFILAAVLALAGWLLEDASLPHLHVGDGPGFYDHDHDAILFASLAGSAPGPDTVHLPGPGVGALPRQGPLDPGLPVVPHRRPDVRGPPPA